MPLEASPWPQARGDSGGPLLALVTGWLLVPGPALHCAPIEGGIILVSPVAVHG